MWKKVDLARVLAKPTMGCCGTPRSGGPLDFTKCRWVAAESSIDDVRPRFSKANDKLRATRDAYVAGACPHTAARNGRVSSAVLGAYMYPNATTLTVPLELN